MLSKLSNQTKLILIMLIPLTVVILLAFSTSKLALDNVIFSLVHLKI